MKGRKSFFAIAALVPCLAFAMALVDAVDPMIGAVTYPEETINNIHGFGKTFPGAASPFGTVQLSPDTITGGDNGPGYSYSHKTIEGFSFARLSGIGWYGEFGNIQVMPCEGVSAFSHERETARAGYYSVFLDDCRVRAELTAAGDTGVIRLTYPENPKSILKVDFARRIGELSRAKRFSRQEIAFESDREFTGRLVCDHRDGGWGRGDGQVDYTLFFRAKSSRPLPARTLTGGLTNCVLTAVFPTVADEAVELEVKISFENVPEPFAAQGFDAVRTRSHAVWETAFAGVSVAGGTEKERTIFATALYHALLDPRDVGAGDGFRRRTVFSGWDVFRSEMPLLTLIRPDVVSDLVNSMMETVTSGKRTTLPRWDIFGCPGGCMVGHPIIPVMADAWEKGIRTFDGKLALDLAVKTMADASNEPRGWVHSDLSRTLEYAYDDWCVARLAEMQGREDLARTHFARAKCYTNCWDESVGWMHAREADGTWRKWYGRKVHDQGCVESNPYQQGWFVPHDPEGLVRLMGGRGKFTDELESFFEGTPADFGWNDYYNHPNEPCHFIPYQFAFSEKPWLTQKWTRRILAQAYGTGPYGLCGNEDVGQMSAWYVLSAIGLHPNCPGDGKWYLTSPIFTETVIRLDPKYYPGGTFTIRAPKADAEHVYIRSVRLNGKTLDRLWISTKEVSAGGILELDLAQTSER